MTDQDARAQVKSSAVMIRHAVESITEVSTAAMAFRELNGVCHKLVPLFRKGHSLITHIVPDAQLRLWEEFAAENSLQKQ